MSLLSRLRVAGVRSRQRSYRAWWALVCLAGFATVLVTAFAVTGGVPQQHNSDLRPAVRAIPATSNGRQAGAADSTGPPFARVDPPIVSDGDLVAKRMVDASGIAVPLDPDDDAFLRDDGEGSHIGEPLDPDDESAMPASDDVSHIGNYLDPLNE